MLAALLALLLPCSQQDPAGDAERTREHLLAFVQARARGDAEAEARSGAALETLAGSVGSAPWSELITTALSWSDEEVARLSAFRARLREWRGAASLPESEDLVTLRAEAEALGADALHGDELGLLGHRLSELGRDREGYDHVLWVAARGERFGDRELQAWALGWCAQNAWQRGELERAVELLLRAGEVAALLGDALGEVRHLADVARIRLTQGEFDAALACAERAEARARASGSRDALRSAGEARGSLLLELGRHREALALCLELSPLDAGDLPRDEAQVRLDILGANALSDVGRLESAARLARRAHANALAAEVKRVAPLLELEAKLSLGLLLGDLGRGQEGLALLDAAAEEYEGLADPRGVAWAQKNRGWVLFALGRHAEAVTAFERAQAGGRELGVPYLEGLAALGIAEALSAEGEELTAAERERVERELALAEDRAERLAERQLSWRIAAVRGRLHALAGDDRAALAEFTRCVQGIERWRRRLAAPGLVEHALRLRSDPYREAALAAARLGDAPGALAFAGLLQARLVHDLRARGDGPLAEPEAPHLAGLRERIGRLELELSESRGEAREARRELTTAEEELDAALLAAELTARQGLRPHRGAVTGAEVRAALAGNGLDAALVFLVGGRQTLAFVLAPRSEASLRLLDVGREALASLCERLRHPMRRFEAGELDLANLGFDVDAARELHELLLAPLALPDGARIALVADEALTAIPFEMLVTGGEPGPIDPELPFAHLAALRFFGDEHALAYYGSLADLVRPAPAARAGALTVFLAPEALGVPHGRAEADGIARAARSRSVEVVADATSADVAARAPRAAILHFAAHGRVDRAAPAQGHLVLGSGASGVRDERLEAWEIEGLELGGALAVLSACHTGEGTWFAGAGLAGLTRGFLVAGAREVVASQWAVEDRASARFMELFYAALEHEPSVPEALRRARLALRGEVDPRGLALAHPYFWAAWVVHR